MNNDLKILVVDDEPNILQGFQRQLRKQFDIAVAESGTAALHMLESSGPYAVIVTDMRMPTMNGLELLQRVKQQFPQTIRVMLTGNVDYRTAIRAVNEGSVFRFLTKPCSPEVLAVVLTAALEQYSLVASERDFMSNTLSCSIDLFGEILSMLNPAAFNCTAKVRQVCREICASLEVANAWDVTMGATLALVGCIAIPEQILTRIYRGETLSPDDQLAFDGHPAIGGHLIGRVPKLERVAEIVRRQNEPYSITAQRGPLDEIGFAANILKSAIDLSVLGMRGLSHEDAVAHMQNDPKVYRPEIVHALSRNTAFRRESKIIKIAQLIDGMTLDENLMSLKGELLLARGSSVSPNLRDRLLSLARTPRGVREPIRVLCQPIQKDQRTPEYRKTCESEYKLPFSKTCNSEREHLAVHK